MPQNIMTKLQWLACIAALCISFSKGFIYQPMRHFGGDISSWAKYSTKVCSRRQIYPHLLKTGGVKVSMSMVAEVGESTPSDTVDAFANYAVGQEHEGIVTSAKPFGVFVSIAENARVLLPRSKMSKGSFEKLKAMQKAKSSEAVRVELTSINAQNQTLTGLYKPATDPLLFDFQAVKALSRKQLQQRAFEATVVSTHDFGVLAELNGYGVDGILPISMLPDKMSAASVMKSYTPGMQLQVYIGEIKPNDKVTLSLQPAPDGTTGATKKDAIAKGTEYLDISPEHWLQGQVQSVTNFGLFVRPADHDLVGMVHLSRIPKELLAVLKQRIQQDSTLSVPVPVAATPTASTSSAPAVTDSSSAQPSSEAASIEETSSATETDVPRVWSSATTAAIEQTAAKKKPTKKAADSKSELEVLFAVGDVVKVRVQSVDSAAGKVDFSMMPYKQGEQDGSQESEYIVEGRDPEGEESRYEEERRAAEEVQAFQHRFDAEDALLWWRGLPYVKTATQRSLAAMQHTQEERVIYESQDIVDGTWRRMFELDMRQDAADFSNKGYDAEMKEIAEEIGELAGLDEDLRSTDRFDTSDYQNKVKFGAFVDSSIFPAAWREELDFFQRLEEREKEIDAKLRGGKKYDREEFEAAVRQAQAGAAEMGTRMGRGTSRTSSGSGAGGGGSDGERGREGGDNVRVWKSLSTSVPAGDSVVLGSELSADKISEGLDREAHEVNEAGAAE